MCTIAEKKFFITVMKSDDIVFVTVTLGRYNIKAY